MFLGVYDITLDSKWRISVPAKLRPALLEAGGKVVLTADLQKNLLIYTMDEWLKASAKLEKLSTVEPRQRAIKQLYLGYACEVDLDSTGRLLLPPMLRQFAGMTDDKDESHKLGVLSGMGNKLEFWKRETWEAANAKALSLLSSEGFDFGAELEALSI